MHGESQSPTGPDLEAEFSIAWTNTDAPPDVFAFLVSHPQASVRERGEVLLADQFHRWKSGREILVEEYLSRCPDVAADTALKLQLVVEECVHRRKRGETIDVAAVAARFPDIEQKLKQQLGMAVDVETVPYPLRKLKTTPPIADAHEGDDSHPARHIGEYELLGEIARGGMGVVYKARQTKLNRIVALKTIKSGQLAGNEEVRRFQAEAQAAAALDHPNIVPIFEVGTAPVDGDGPNVHFFSMGYVEGPSFQEKLESGPLPPKEAAALLSTIADAVQYAHDQGIVHRDLKPGNVLLAGEQTATSRARQEGGMTAPSIGPLPDGRDSSGTLNSQADTVDSNTGASRAGTTRIVVPRITDFGLAKNIATDSGMTATGQILGTPSYMSPEQAAGATDAIGPRADVYALGAMLYAALTGRPPFQAANVMETLKQVVEREAASPRVLNPDIDKDLETICLKCLEKNPDNRYTTAAAFATDLKSFLEGRPIHARPVGRANRLWRWHRRNQVVSWLLFAAGLFLLTLAIGGPLMAWRESQLRATNERTQREKLESQIDGLLSADPANLSQILTTLEADRAEVRPRLQESWDRSDLSDEQRTRIALFLLPDDKTLVPFLEKRLSTCPEELFPHVRNALVAYADDLKDRLWRAVDETAASKPQQQLRSASLLAAIDANNHRWKSVAPRIVDSLLGENTTHLRIWLDGLRPVKSMLIPELTNAFRDSSPANSSRAKIAADLLADYAADRPRLIAELVLDATPDQFRVLVPLLRDAHDGIGVLESAITTEPQPLDRAAMSQALASQDMKAYISIRDTWQQRMEKQAKQQSNAVAALLQLGSTSTVWSHFRHREDPRAAVHAADRIHRYLADPTALVDRLASEPDASIRYYLLLAVGGFPPERLSPELRGRIVQKAIAIFKSDRDSGCHGAAEWLLRHWKQEAAVEKAVAQIAIRKPQQNRDWYVNKLGQSLAVFHKPVEFKMGITHAVPQPGSDMTPKPKRIDRAFAIASTETTYALFRRFQKERPDIREPQNPVHEPAPRHPRDGVTWYEAADFCNWLSKQNGIPKSQWCYLRNGTERYAAGMKPAPDYLSRTGYRLPTEAEWEYACRGGTTTGYSYGEAYELMPRHGWSVEHSSQRSQPVGLLKPNRFGLFDMHGNLDEWCHERQGLRDGSIKEAVDTAAVVNSIARVIRGGSYYTPVVGIGSGTGGAMPPSQPYLTLGFRVARTIRVVRSIEH